MALVELLYFPDCPHVAAARAQLSRAFAVIGVVPAWTEVDVSAPGAPEYTRGYGSPTVLVNGREVTGTPRGGGTSCRVYVGSEVQGAPPLEVIVGCLRAASQPNDATTSAHADIIDSSRE